MSVVDLRGGTDAAMAPPVGYLQQILLPTLRRLFNIDITEKVCDLLRCSTILHAMPVRQLYLLRVRMRWFGGSGQLNGQVVVAS
jgi:hypothetical protein